MNIFVEKMKYMLLFGHGSTRHDQDISTRLQCITSTKPNVSMRSCVLKSATELSMYLILKHC
jgi:hypothetical protein